MKESVNSSPDTERTQPEPAPYVSLDRQFARLFDLDELPSISRFGARQNLPRRAKVQSAAKSILALTLGIAAALLFLVVMIVLFALRPR